MRDNLMKQYSWISVFNAISEQVLKYRNNQEQLVDFLISAGVKMPMDGHSNGEMLKLKVIDPFTFIALALVGGEKTKKTHIKALLSVMNINMNSPDDFNGVPSVQAQRAWLFSYASSRGEQDIDILWELFCEAKEDNIQEQTFSAALNVKQVGFTKLTQYMFYYFPKSIFPIDSVTRPYIEQMGITVPDENWVSYTSCMKQIRTHTSEEFYEISYEAWKEQQFTMEQAVAYLTNRYGVKGKTIHIVSFEVGVGEKQIALDPKLKTVVKLFLGSDPREKFEFPCRVYEKNKSRHNHLNQHAEQLSVGNEAFLVTVSKESELEELCDWYEHSISTNKDNIELISDSKTKGEIMSQNTIFYGPPGTGKTYNTVSEAVNIIDPTFVEVWEVKGLSDTEVRKKIKAKFDECLKSGEIVFTTFHQSYGYEDFVEGLKVVTSDDGSMKYFIEKGIFRDVCKNAAESGIDSLTKLNDAIEKLKDELTEKPDSVRLKTETHKKEFTLSYRGATAFYAKPDAGKHDNPVSIESIKKLYMNPNIKGGTEGIHFKVYTTPVIQYLIENYELPIYKKQLNNMNKPYVLIIDEINRGNISKIFGELITLIEPDKREGEDEALTVTLPYSKESFSVPKNVHIIGTMNTADASIAKLDVALRRRFKFTEMPPNPSLLNNVSLEDHDGKLVEINLNKMLTVINQRIELLYDRDHTIGHSFFMKSTSNWTIDDLATIFEKSIIPLLQEYFFDDWQRIHWVLDVLKADFKVHFITKKHSLSDANSMKNLMGENWQPEDHGYNGDVWQMNPDALMNPSAYLGIYEG